MKGQAYTRVASTATQDLSTGNSVACVVSLGGTATDVIGDGDFAADTAWTISGSNLVITGGQLVNTSPATGAATQDVLSVGNEYLVAFRLVSADASALQPVRLGTNTLLDNYDTIGVTHISGTCEGSATFRISSSGSLNYVLDDCAVYDLTALDTGVDPKERYCIEQIHYSFDAALSVSTQISICDSTGTLWSHYVNSAEGDTIDFTENGRLDGFYGQRGGGLAVIMSPALAADAAKGNLNVKWK